MRKALVIAATVVGTLAVLILSAWGARELDRTLTTRMEELKDSTMRSLESLIGRTITYGKISPSFFQSIEISDLVIHDTGAEDKPLITIRGLRVYYSLIRLVISREPMNAIKEIRLLNTRFVIDLDKDKDVVDLVLRLAGAGSTGPASGQRLRARLSGSNIGLAITSQGSAFSVDDMYFQIDAQEQAIAVSLRGNVQGAIPGGFTFTSNLKAQGNLDRSLTSADVSLKMRSFESSMFSTGAQSVQLVWKGNSIEVRKIQDRSPIELDLRADLAAKEVTLSVQSEDLRPDRLFSLGPRFSRYASWMKVPITTSGHLTYRFVKRSLEYQADVSAMIEDQLPVHEIRLDVSVQGSEKEAFFQPLRLSSSAGNLEFDGSLMLDSLYPAGLLTLTDVDSGTGERVNASLTLDRMEGSLNVHGTHFTIGALDFDSFRLTLAPAPDGASFTLATSFAGDQPNDSLQASGMLRFGQPLGAAMVEGRATTIAAPVISITASLRKIPPAKLYHLAMGAGDLSSEQRQIYDILARFSVTADVSLSTDFSTVSAASSVVTVAAVDDSTTTVSFGFSADTHQISLSNVIGSWKSLSVSGGFVGKFGSAGQIAFTSNLTFLGTPYALSGSYSSIAGLAVKGSYGLDVTLSRLTNGSFFARLKAEKFPLPLSGQTLPVSVQCAALIAPSGDWSIDFPSLTIFSVPFLQSKSNTIQASGRLTPTHVDLTSVAFTDAFSTLVGSASADITMPADLLAGPLIDDISIQGTASLRNATTGESYTAKGGIIKRQLGLSVQFNGSPLARLAATAFSGSLSGGGTIAGSLEQPGIDLAVSLKNGKLGADPITAGAQVTMRPGIIQLRGFSFSYLSHIFTDGAGQVDLQKGAYTLNVRYQGVYFADKVGLTFNLDGIYTSGSLPSGGLIGDGLQGRLTLSAITVSSSPVSSWSISYRTKDGKLSIDGGPGNSVHGWLDSQFAFSVALSDPLPVNGVAAGKITGDTIAATLDVESFDLPVINAILKSSVIPTTSGPAPIYYVTSGVAAGKLSVQGTINDPDFYGQLDVVGGGLRSAYVTDEAGPMKATFTFDGRTFHSDTVTTSAGAAKITAKANFTLDHWSPLAYDITLGIDGPSPARVRGHFGRLMANGSAFGQLHIFGDDRKTNVTGSVLVNDCQIALGEAPTGKFVPEDPPTFVAITVETGKRVEFFWPTADVPVLRTSASPGGKIAITYRGDTGAYTAKGTTGVQGGEIYYFDRSFIMKKGSITFNEDQNTFDPRITASAEVRESDPDTGEVVKISLNADGTLSHFSPHFTSDPPRTETAILAMIGAPILNRAESQGLGMAALVYSDILSQNWILRPFEEKVRQVLNLDMFSINTQILPNLLAEKLFNVSVNPLDNTSVSLGKYIGNDLFLEVLVGLQQQPLPSGTASVLSSSVVNGLGLQPDVELSLEWATPFFLLNWTFQPQHPEDLFLSDNSLSFSWKYSY